MYDIKPLYTNHSLLLSDSTVINAKAPFAAKNKHHINVILAQYRYTPSFSGEEFNVLSCSSAKRKIITGGIKKVIPNEHSIKVLISTG
jgi:hypothetical protein